MNKKIFSLLVVSVFIGSTLAVHAQEIQEQNSVETPSESTVFFADPQQAKQITESSETTYLSESETLFSGSDAQKDL